jgi:large subunit ribosomal protein L28e
MIAEGLTQSRTYGGVIKATADRDYRTDLRKEAVARASAIRKSQKPVKESKPTKPRGAKARKAEEA